MNNKSFPPAIFLMGPTASGKTSAAVHLLQKLPVELISVDSALVYRDMDIGTAKPDAETLALAPHYLINMMPPTATYSASDFRVDALRLMQEITSRGNVPVLVGGTMLYFKVLENGLSGLPEANAEVRARIDAEADKVGWPAMHEKLARFDSETAARLKPNDMQRIQRALEVYEITGETMSALFARQINEPFPYNILKIALVPNERKTLHERIAQRFDQMLEDGFIKEVKQILLKYPELTIESTAMRCVGYRQVIEHLNGAFDEAELRDRGVFATRQLAKRQLTWLRGMEGVLEIDCLQQGLNSIVEKEVKLFLNK